MKFVKLNSNNLEKESLFCIKDIKSQGFKVKSEWLLQRFNEGLQITIAKDETGKAVGFIEFVPGEYAWRPVNAQNHLFIHCLFVYPNKAKNKGLGSQLIALAEKEAYKLGLEGLASFASKGAWLSDNRLFLNNGFEKIDQQGRMELMVKNFTDSENPKFSDWKSRTEEYQGWQLIYANQCPWHVKAVEVLKRVSLEQGFKLNIHELKSAKEAQMAPSGFGVFSLVKDGKLLEDHYISETRFKNIIKKELS